MGKRGISNGSTDHVVAQSPGFRTGFNTAALRPSHLPQIGFTKGHDMLLELGNWASGLHQNHGFSPQYHHKWVP